MTERVTIVVYDTETGNIRQKVKCLASEADQQHQAWPGHASLNVTGLDVDLNGHAVDLTSKKLMPRTSAAPNDIDAKRQELILAAATDAASSSDVTNLLLKAAGGDEDAKRAALALATRRQMSQQKLAGLLARISNAKSKDDLSKITW